MAWTGRARLCGEGAPVPVAERVLVPDLVLVVVVPGGVEAVVEERALHARPPPGAALRVGEVQVEAEPVPELGQGGLSRLPVLDEEAAVERLADAGVVVEKAGLDVGDRPHAGVLEPRQGRGGVRELLAVPVEGVAARADHGVAGAEVEGIAGDVVPAAIGDEGRDAGVGVRRVGDGHGGDAEAERPQRREGLAAGEADIAADHVREGRAEEEVEVEVAVGRRVAAEQAVVVVDGRAEVDVGDREVVVEDAVGRPALAVDEDEGDDLVERIAQLGVEAGGVHRVEAEAAARAVERPRLVAEAVMPLGRVPDHVVREGAGLARQEVGLRRPVAGEGFDRPRQEPVDPERVEAHRAFERARAEADAAGSSVTAKSGQGKPDRSSRDRPS